MEWMNLQKAECYDDQKLHFPGSIDVEKSWSDARQKGEIPAEGAI